MRGRLVAVALVLPLALGAGAVLARQGATANSSFEVLGHVRPPGLYAGDVVLHRGHAYLGSHNGRTACPAEGVRVYDVRNPRRPRRVGTFGRIAGTWTEKTIVARVATPRFTGDLAVTSVQACRGSGPPQQPDDPTQFRGFVLTDVSRPGRPRELARVRTDPRGSHEIWLAARGAKAYVYTAIIASEILDTGGAGPGRADFRIFDVSEPRAPREVGSWGAWRELGVVPFQPGAPRVDGNFVHSVITNAAATRAYLSYWDLGTVILDVSSPARPRYLGRTAATENAHSAWLGRDGLLVETHETAGGIPTFYDVTNPAGPRRLGQLRLPREVLARGLRWRGAGSVAGLALEDSVHDAKVVGPLGLFSWYSQGVVAADLSNPREPRFLARFLPTPAPDPEQLICPDRPCAAVVGVDVEGDLIAASDLVSGLWLLRLRR